MRRWLIAWLAGDRPVALNIEIRGALVVAGRDGLVKNVLLEPPRWR
jgi:hypothetical protein